MNKKPETMTLKELWQLFPIFLVAPNQEWTHWYEEEIHTILSLVPHENVQRISHIGSTAVSDIWAKNIVDILLEVQSENDLERVKDILVQNGWVCRDRSAKRMFLNKGYTETGFADKVFHLHIRIGGDNDELYFRDYLNENPDAAKAYEQLKLSLCKQYENDRDGYTNAKTDFIQHYTEKAKKEYHGRYRFHSNVLEADD